MSTNTTSTTVPVFRKGDKVKLKSTAELHGRRRCGPGLKGEVGVSNVVTTRYTAAENQTFTIFDITPVRASVAPGQTPQASYAMATLYRLYIPLYEARTFLQDSTDIKFVIVHSHLRLRGSVAGALCPKKAFNQYDYALLTKDLAVQPIDATYTAHYPAGTLVRVMTLPLTTKGQPASTDTPADKCRYHVVPVEKKTANDVHWKADYDVTVTSIQAA